MRTSWLLWGLLAACSSPQAQPYPSDPAAQAWFAWRATEHGAVQQVPEIVTALRAQFAQPASKVSMALMRQQLDALVILGARVDAELLMLVAQKPNFAVPALLLAARDPKLHAQALLNLRPSLTGLDRQAADALLAVGAPHALTLLLLDEARLHVTVHAVDEHRGAGGGSFSTTIGCGAIQAPAGWPPLVRYEIVAMPRTGATPLVTSPRALGWVRHVRAGPVMEAGKRTRTNGADNHVWLHLAALAHLEPQPLLQATTAHVAITWTSAEQFEAELQRLTAERQACWTRLLNGLVQQGLLDAASTARALPLSLTVLDARADPSSPLR